MTRIIILATMLFMEDHIQAVLPALQARRDQCDAMIGCMSAGEVIRLIFAFLKNGPATTVPLNSSSYLPAFPHWTAPRGTQGTR